MNFSVAVFRMFDGTWRARASGDVEIEEYGRTRDAAIAAFGRRMALLSRESDAPNVLAQRRRQREQRRAGK